MSDTPQVRDGKLTLATHPNPVVVGDDAWRQWLRAPGTTSFRFGDEGAAFTARRELRAGHAYWYAYRRRGPKLQKVYLGRPEEIDLGRLHSVAAKLDATAASSPRRESPAPPPGGPDARYPSRIPTAATPLVGRTREVGEARARLLRPEVRLLTFSGPGGTGKTRVALEVAASLVNASPDGVFFVDLAPIRDPSLVHVTIALTLGIRDAGDQPLRETVRLYLETRQMLLVLDNFEQVIAVAPLVAELLAECPGLKIAVTSREPLHLRWEYEWPVGPLALPAPAAAADRNRIARSPAVELFVARARASVPAFALTDENAGIIADICTRLDGLPLAIELAAARVKLLPLAAIRANLAQSLVLLANAPRDAPARHTTMRAAIAWSYDLLDPEEQAVFRRLAVFVGGFTIGAARAVCGDEVLGVRCWVPESSTQHLTPGHSLLDRIGSLVEKNLIRSDALNTPAPAEPRFRLLETIREFGLEVLAASGELSDSQAHHARYFLAVAEEGDRHMREPLAVEWLDRLQAEHDNLRAALQWSLAFSERLEIGARLASALAYLWAIRGYFSSGRAWYERIVAQAGGAVPSSPVQVRVLLGAAELARWQGDYESAIRFSEQGIGLGQRLGAPSETAQCLVVRGFIASHQAQYAIAHAALDQGLQLAREVDDQGTSALVLTCLGLLARLEGACARARALSEESLRFFRSRGELWGVAMSLDTLGTVARRQGQYQLAQSFHEESFDVSQTLGFASGIALSLASLGHVARALGDDLTARTRYTASLQIYRNLGDRRGMALTLGNLGALAKRASDPNSARAYLAESLSVARMIGDKRMTGAALHLLAGLDLARGDLPAAIGGYAASLRLSGELQDKRSIARTLEGCAAVLSAAGRTEAALSLCILSDLLLDSIGEKRSSTDQAGYEELCTTIQSVLGASCHAVVSRVAPALGLQPIVDHALALIESKPTMVTGESAPRENDAIPLTQREREVAVLIARGLTNRAIATRLVIANRTADTHVSNILGKLGLNARSQIAAWAVGHQLLPT